MTAQPTSDVVSQLVTVRLLAPGRPTDIEADFGYDPNEPYAVSIRFDRDEVAGTHELARSSLARGITEPIGGGQVSLWPSLTGDGRAVVVMSLTSSLEDHLVCEIRTDQLHRFLTRTFALVPVGTETGHLDLDAVVERLLASEAQ